MEKRSHERVAEIDTTIRLHYPAHGADWVAEKLGESRNYIQERAWYLKVRKNNRKGEKKSSPKKNVSSAEVEKLKEERDMWRRKYQAERIRARRYYNQLQSAV